MKRTTLLIGLTLAVAGIANAQLFPERDPADVNGDGVINAVDMAAVLGKWGPAPQPWAIVLERCPDPSVVTDEKLREAITATGLPWRVQDIGTGIEMLLVPPGTFDMGCSPSLQHGCNGNETPVHTVMLTRAFYLGRYEVTQAQWSAVSGGNPSEFQCPSDEVPIGQVPTRPVERVSWDMIQAFEASTGMRLPTEAEWEFACRAGTTTAFNNGSDDDATLDALAWFNENAGAQTRPVGQKVPNALGFHDMHGNVWEWVADRYGANYYSQSPELDPPGPAVGSFRVIRGGSWFDGPNWGVRSSFRSGVQPTLNLYNNGVRAARNP